MNGERNFNAYSRTSSSEKNERRIGLKGKVAAGLATVVLGGGIAYHQYMESQNEYYGGDTGVEVNIGDGCIDMLPGSVIRPEADASNPTFAKANSAYEVQNSITLCGLDDVRSIAGSDISQEFLGVPIEDLEGTEMMEEDIATLAKSSETGYAWVYRSPETAQIIDAHGAE